MFLRTAPLVLAFALILASAFLFILFHRLRTARQSLRNSQVRLSAALRESEASRSLLAAVFAAQTDPILVFGADGKVVRTNPAAHRSWGFDPTGWHHSEVLAKLDIRPEWGVGFIERALAGEATLNLEVKAGTRMLEASSAPMRDFEGCIIGAVVVQRDATSRHRMRSALEMTIRDLEVALQEKTILLKEVHHRVKNNLAVISSVLAMKVDAAHSAETRQALEDSRQRVRSMALIHEQLYGQENLHTINFAEYTAELLRELTEVLVSDPSRIAVETVLEPIELAVNLAVPCGLILHELVTNAFKHAFPGGRRGQVRVGFREWEPDVVELSVQDNGVGFLPGSCDSQSLGLRIVEILARQLDGVFESTPRPHDEGQDRTLRADWQSAPSVSCRSIRPTSEGIAEPRPSENGRPGARFVLRFPARLN
jgi:PAS domain S-box-containing protein